MLAAFTPTLVATTPAAAAVPTSLQVNFQATGVTPPAGYTADTGAAYNGTSGWQTATGTPLDLSANARVRHSAQSPDVRYDTMVLMQAPSGSGNTTPGTWVSALANGTYDLTVAVGDPTAINSVYVITAQPGTAQATTVIDHYTPTAAAPWSTQTKRVTVANGQLVLSPTGGSNTKIDFMTAAPVTNGSPSLSVTSADTATLGLSSPRLVYSMIRGAAFPAAKSFTFTNSGSATLTVSGLSFAGANASDFALATGQASSLSIPAGGSATVSVQFHPADPTGCSTNNSTAIGNANRAATLTYATNDPAHPTGSADVAGLDSCGAGGNAEPVLDQILPVLGYTDVVDNQYIDRRFIGPARFKSGTDEVISPYFRAANPAQPVSLTPIAHYGGPNTQVYGRTGWYAQGAAMTSTSACSSACQQLWTFPADPSSSTYNQNQKLLPVPVGTTTFSPAGSFGLYSGDFSDVNFSDDSLNIAHWTDNTNVPVPHYLHDLRIYPAYGPGHVAIPNTYVVGIDISRVPDYKNNDYQDVVLLLRNATPAIGAGPAPGSATTVNLAGGGSVSGSCAVTGFDGVLPNTAGNQCVAGKLAFASGGLAVTSTAGQLADNNQQNALYKTFDASRGAFTVTTRVVGPLSYLASNYQQVGAFFGPDQNNFVKVEAEANGGPHLTMFYREKGVAGTVGSVSLPALTTASTLDLVIKGNTTVPDPLPYGDAYHVSGYPLDQLTVFYSLNGGALVQVGTVKRPADVTGWFSTSAKAGILDSNSGSPTPVTATFSRFSITSP